MELHIDAAFGHLNAFRFEEFSLQGSVRFADKKFTACAKNTMPRYAFAGGAASHGSACGARPARKAQGSRNGPIR